MKKKHLIILLSVLGVLLLAYGLTFWLTAAPKKVADQFFTYIRGSRYTYAHELTSPSFQENTPLDKFVDYSNSLQLKKQNSFSSSFRMPGTKKATLYGKLNYDGYKFTASLVMIKMGEDWKIANLKIEASRQRLNIEEPEAEEISLLLQDTLSNLIYGIQSGDYAKVYAMFAVKLQEALPIDVLANEFSGLKDVLADQSLNTGDEMKVTLNKSFDPAGILELNGTYEDAFQFEFKYVYEEESWNIVAMSANQFF
ncbi:MAG: hypothetical protein PHU71_00955 [Candidatus Gracilibacteria bacterium]|nr:hypothetical protein [Candidatus Gracilibacteria bacterium]